MRSFDWFGLTINIEHEVGEVRFTGGNPLTCAYGHVANTFSDDLEEVDVYVGLELGLEEVYKIYQLDQNGKFDEVKFFIGFGDIELAKKAYLDNIPPKYFGAIFNSSISEIKDFLITLEALSKGSVVVESAELPNGEKRAKIVRSVVTPGYGLKESQNQVNGVPRKYNDRPIPEVVKELQALLKAGVPIVNRLGHVKQGQHFNDNPPISRLVWVDIDPKGQVICDDEFFSDPKVTPEAFEWSKRAYKKEWLPRSWESLTVCESRLGVGNCDLKKIYSIAWLDPAKNEPGFSNAKVEQVLSVFEAKACNCSQDCLLCKSKLNNLVKQNLIEARGVSSGGKITKGAKFMNADFLAKLAAEQDPEKRKLMVDIATMFGSNSAEPPMLPPPIPENKDKQDPPVPPVEEGNKSYEQLMATVRKTEESVSNLTNNFQNMFISAFEKRINAEAEAEKKNKEAKESVKTQLTQAMEAKSFESHDLTNKRLYPQDHCLLIVKEAKEKIDKENWSWETARVYLDTSLTGLAKLAPPPKTNEIPVFENGQANPVNNIMAQLHEAADKSAGTSNYGRKFLSKREKTQKKLQPKIDKISTATKNKIGRALYLASEAIRTNKQAPDYELTGLALNTGLLTNEAAAFVNTAANIGTQAFLSNLIYERQFQGADYLDVVAPLVGSELFDYNTNDPFLAQAGKEVRFTLDEFVRPKGDGNLIMRTPGSSSMAQGRLNTKFDSCTIREMAFEFLFETMQVNSLKNTLNYDYLGRMGNGIGLLFRDRMSRIAMTNVDNAGRQYRYATRTDEVSVSGNLVAGNSIVVDGATIVYPNTIEGSAVAYPVSHIVRMTMDQPAATGTNVASRLIVVPEFDEWNDRDGKQTRYLNAIKVVVGATTYNSEDLGFLNEFNEIEPAYPGHVPKLAIDFNNCLVLFTAAAGVHAANLPTLTYDYVPLLTATSGNLVILDLTVPGGTDEDVHINNLLNTVTTYSSRVQQERSVIDGYLGGSLIWIQAIISRAKRWQANYNQIGSKLEEELQDYNWKGKLTGGPKLWGTDSYLLGGNSVSWLGVEGSSKIVMGENMQTSDFRWVELTGDAANDPVKSTTGQKQQFRQTFGVKAPRVRKGNTREAHNEPTLMFKIKGTAAIAGV